MSRRTNILIRTIRDALSSKDDSHEYFWELAATGEMFRRALVMADSVSQEASETLARYEQEMRGMPAGLRPEIDERLDDRLDGLEQMCVQPLQSVSTEELKVQIDSVDEALSLAAAAGRAGLLSATEVDALGERARRRMVDLAPRMPGLWQYAEDMELAYGPDPDYPGLFSFWEELACLAESRLDAEAAIATAYMDPAKRTALYQRAKALLCPEPTPGLVDRIIKLVEGLVELVLPTPAPVPAATYDDSTRALLPPRLDVIVDEPGVLSIVWANTALIVEVPEGNRFEGVTVFDGRDRTECVCAVKPHRLEIPLSPFAGAAELRISVVLNGRTVELPPLKLSQPSSK